MGPQVFLRGPSARSSSEKVDPVSFGLGKFCGPDDLTKVWMGSRLGQLSVVSSLFNIRDGNKFYTCSTFHKHGPGRRLGGESR